MRSTPCCLRQASGGVESLRAIPWIFAWTQNRLVLPAWLGVGDALTEAIQQANASNVLAVHEMLVDRRLRQGAASRQALDGSTFCSERYVIELLQTR